MARKIKVVGGEGEPKRPSVPTTKPKGKKPTEATFRSPHPGLEVLVVKGERTDLGAGNYSITPPKTVEFENRGNYGEITVDPETAGLLREKIKDREARGLLPKYIEV